MFTYLISYDLLAKNIFDYSRLIEYIKSYGSWAKPLESFWLIKTNKSLYSVRDELMSVVATNDKIIVMNVTGANWGSFNLSAEVVEWLKGS